MTIASTLNATHDLTTHIYETSRRFGIINDADKTKIMVTEKTKETPITINIQGEATAATRTI